MVQLVRIVGGLPEGFAALRAAADAEGFRALSRLQAEWPGPFVTLLAAYLDGGLAGVGGLTAEPGETDAPALRIRRLYVHPQARRAGVGTALVNALLQEALGSARLVTVNAADTSSPEFWTWLGFRPAAGRAWTHEFRAHSAA
jgi:GNAT superfamily N-acetyltransferase